MSDAESDYEAMLARARKRAVYDDLAVGEMMTALRDLPQPVDLVLAADVLVYVGDLGPVFAAVATALAPDGVFAFTIQRTVDARGVSVGTDRRFAHSRDHLCARATQHGFAVLSVDEASTRRDAGADVPGFVVVLARG